MIENAIPHIVYDLSLPLEERKKNAKIFPSRVDAARYLGTTEKYIARRLKPGTRVESNGKEYAIRIHHVKSNKSI
jgi:hypothetical protein